MHHNPVRGRHDTYLPDLPFEDALTPLPLQSFHLELSNYHSALEFLAFGNYLEWCFYDSPNLTHLAVLATIFQSTAAEHLPPNLATLVIMADPLSTDGFKSLALSNTQGLSRSPLQTILQVLYGPAEALAIDSGA